MNTPQVSHDKPDLAAGEIWYTRERLDLVLNSANMGTWDWDPALRSMKWDRRMHSLFGIDQGAFGGEYEDFLNLLDPEDRERVAEEVALMVENCSDYDGEFRTIWPADGTSHAIRMRSKTYCDVHARKTCISGVAWDVTERRRTEDDLVRKRYLFNALMDNLPDNIYFKDSKSRFLAVNRAMASWFGFDDPSGMVGKTDFDLFTGEHAQAALENEKKIMESGEPMVGIEEEETWSDGHKTWVSTTKVPLRGPKGRLIGTFGLSRDITMRKRSEEQVARITQELRRKNEMLEEDLKMARELQHAMLPQAYPRFPDSANGENSIVQFYHYYTPSMAVSGDFFDVFKISDSMAGIFICDVMGHGVRAAMVAAMIRTLIGELHATWQNPGKLLAELNRTLRGALGHSLVPMFASAFYVMVDLKKGKLHYANAGHPHPLRMQHSGGLVKPAELNGVKPGPALGLFEEAQYNSCSCELRPHDVVLLFTDGLFEVEGPHGELYDYAMLLRAIGNRSNLSTEQLCQDLIDEVQQFSANKEFSDDVCLVAMEVDSLAPENARTPDEVVI